MWMFAPVMCSIFPSDVPFARRDLALIAPEPDAVLQYPVAGIDIEFLATAIATVGPQNVPFAQQFAVPAARDAEQHEIAQMLADMHLHGTTGIEMLADLTEHIVPAPS